MSTPFVIAQDARIAYTIESTSARRHQILGRHPRVQRLQTIQDNSLKMGLTRGCQVLFTPGNFRTAGSRRA